MSFANPVFGTTHLQRERVQSPNFSPGVDGWALYKNGDAEFNNATFRGFIVLTDDKAILIFNDQGNLLYSMAGLAGEYNGISYEEGFIAYSVSETFPDLPPFMLTGLIKEPQSGGIFIRDVEHPDAELGQETTIFRQTSATHARLNIDSGRMVAGNSSSNAKIILTSDNQAMTVFRRIQLEAFTIDIGGSASASAVINLTNAQTNITGTVNTSSTVMRPKDNEEATNLTGFSNTAFAAGSPVCGVTFTAPPSGSGKYLWHVNCEPDTADDLFVSVETRTGSTIGSGTVVRAGSSDRSIHPPQIAGTGEIQCGTYWEISGLTPGSVYNAFTVHRMTAGTGSIFHRAIRWEPDF